MLPKVLWGNRIPAAEGAGGGAPDPNISLSRRFIQSHQFWHCNPPRRGEGSQFAATQYG